MISSRCHYALNAVLELAKREGAGLATIAQIARARKIPARFLEAILVQLKQNGLAQSVRGKEGGYALARPASAITVGDVIRIFEGPLMRMGTESRRKGRKRSASGTVFDEIWREADASLAGVFDAVNFAELAERDAKLEVSGHADFVI